MKIRNVYQILVFIFVCACTGFNGWFFGRAGGDTGTIIGIITGIIAGFLFLVGYYHKKKISDKRVGKAVKLGALYGSISGFLVHLPRLFGENTGEFKLFGVLMAFPGAIVGLISGTILGWFLANILSGIRMESEDTSAPVKQERK